MISCWQFTGRTEDIYDWVSFVLINPVLLSPFYSKLGSQGRDSRSSFSSPEAMPSHSLATPDTMLSALFSDSCSTEPQGSYNLNHEFLSQEELSLMASFSPAWLPVEASQTWRPGRTICPAAPLFRSSPPGRMEQSTSQAHGSLLRHRAATRALQSLLCPTQTGTKLSPGSTSQ